MTDEAAAVHRGAWERRGVAALVNTPINYLQIWEQDFIYAYGWQNCIGKDSSMQQLMTSPPG